MADIIDLAERRRLRELERAADEIEVISPRDLGRLSTWIGLATGVKRLPTTAEVIDSQKEKAKRFGKRKVREAADGTSRYITTSVFGDRLGPKVRDKVYDINDYRIVKGAVYRYLSGHAGVHFRPEEEPVYERKRVLGYFKDKDFVYASDPKSALGGHYRPALEKSRLTEEGFKDAFTAYVQVHEYAEAVYVNSTFREKLDEEEHGKLQAYILKALKSAEAEGIYRVAVAIDSQRTDEFGRKIRKYVHADPEAQDISFDFQKSNWAAADGYRFAEAA